MKLERTKNAKRNVAAGLANRIISLALPFVVRTALIYTLGTDYLGLSSLFASILSVLSITELGVGSAIVYHMYKPIAEDDEKTLCALLNFYKKIYRVIGIIILIIGLALIPFLPRLIHGQYPSDISLTWLYLIYLFNASSSYFLFAYYSSLLSAFQRNDLLSNVGSALTISRYVLQAAILFITGNYLLFSIVVLITTVLNNIIVAFIAKKKYPQFTARGDISLELKQDIWVKVKGMLITKIQAVTRNSFDSIFISAFLGLELTAIYSNYYYIMSAVIGVLFIVVPAITAGIGNSVASESIEKNYADMNKINFIYMWNAVWCTICLFCLYQPFMKLWLGSGMVFPFSVMILFCIYFYALKLGDIRSIYLEVNGLWWENRYKAIAESVANIVLNYFLGKLFGVYGILLATIFTIVIINFGYGSRIVFRYYFGMDKLGNYYYRNLIYFCTTLIIGIVTWTGCRLLTNDNLIGFVLKMCLCIAIPNFLYFLIYFHNVDFKVAVPWIIKTFDLQKLKMFDNIIKIIETEKQKY